MTPPKRILRAVVVLTVFGLIIGAYQGALAAKPPAKGPKKIRFDKRLGQAQMILLADGKFEKAADLCRRALEQQPEHADSWFNLALALANLDEPTEALDAARRAIQVGLPPERFLAGPRRLATPLLESDGFAEAVIGRSSPLLHGPMLGCVTDRSAKIWVRTAEEFPVVVLASPEAEMTSPIKSATVFSDAKRDFTAVCELERLEPATEYFYDVQLRGRSVLGRPLPSFRTMPADGEPARFQVGFGGGAGYYPHRERMWTTIASHRLAAFLFLGDNVYIDNPTRPAVQQYTYYRRQSRPEYRGFVGTTPIFAIWDDHDCLTNDAWGGPELDEPPWKPAVWRVFRDNWNNPGYGDDDRPGCWFRFSIATVDFFMLDGRYYRTDPRKPNPTMLGPVQKEWLKEQLKRSDATFKVLASPVPWVLNAKGKSLDTWRGYKEERQELFDFLSEERIEGVILISADRHRSDVWRIDREGDYPLWEFESSKLTNSHTHGKQPGALFSYNEKCSFGQLTFDTRRPDPTVEYEIFNIDNEAIHSVTVRRSELLSP
jgi:alkaline phosphatase D